MEVLEHSKEVLAAKSIIKFNLGIHTEGQAPLLLESIAVLGPRVCFCFEYQRFLWYVVEVRSHSIDLARDLPYGVMAVSMEA